MDAERVVSSADFGSADLIVDQQYGGDTSGTWGRSGYPVASAGSS
jgi:hypothetical protein